MSSGRAAGRAPRFPAPPARGQSVRPRAPEGSDCRGGCRGQTCAGRRGQAATAATPFRPEIDVPKWNSKKCSRFGTLNPQKCSGFGTLNECPGFGTRGEAGPGALTDEFQNGTRGRLLPPPPTPGRGGKTSAIGRATFRPFNPLPCPAGRRKGVKGRASETSHLPRQLPGSSKPSSIGTSTHTPAACAYRSSTGSGGSRVPSSKAEM